jgi:hypothetical protein
MKAGPWTLVFLKRAVRTSKTRKNAPRPTPRPILGRACEWRLRGTKTGSGGVGSTATIASVYRPSPEPVGTGRMRIAMTSLLHSMS